MPNRGPGWREGCLEYCQRLEQVRPPPGAHGILARSSRHSGRTNAANGPAGLSASTPPAAPADATIKIAALTRFAELATFGPRPFWAFTIGVLAVPLGSVPFPLVFSDYRARI